MLQKVELYNEKIKNKKIVEVKECFFCLKVEFEVSKVDYMVVMKEREMEVKV